VPPFYYQTRFKPDDLPTSLPGTFAIITAFATTGETWTKSENAAATAALRAQLEISDRLLGSLTGHSPVKGHAEPSFAASLPFEAACDLGMRFKQDAIYYVDSGILHVSYCDHRRRLEPVGPFMERLDPLP
jgi:Protein of unknown function (DUF3293)